jgi:hypothetical protein
VFIYKKDLDTSKHIQEQFNQLFQSESFCNKMIGAYITRKIEAGGFIRDDVLDYVVSHDFGNDYVDLIYRFFDYLKDLSPDWLEVLLDIIKNKDEQDVSSFLNEVYGAFISGIPLDKVKLCYENAEDPHAFAVALENNSSDGAYSKMLESLSAITNVIEKIEFDRSNQTEEFGHMSDSIAGLKEQLKEKADIIKNRDEQIEHLNELLNSKADITQDELNKIIKYRDFYERKYNAAMDELDKVRDKNCKNELKILELEKRIKEITENTDNMDSKEQSAVNNDFAEKLNLISEKVSKLDEIFTVINSFQSKFDDVHEEIKLLDDSNSSILNTEMTKLTNNFNNIIDDKFDNINSNIDKSFNDNKEKLDNISKLIKERSYNPEDEYRFMDNITPTPSTEDNEDSNNETSGLDLPFGNDETESSANNGDAGDSIDKLTDNADKHLSDDSINTDKNFDVDVEVPDIPDMYDSEKLKSDKETMDATDELQTGLTESKVVEFNEDKKNFFSSFIKERHLRKCEQVFNKIDDNARKKQMIIEYSMDNHIDRSIIKVIKEIFANNDKGDTSISLNFIYHMLLHKATLSEMEDLRDFGTGNTKAS